jgi:putative membrane protein
MEGIISSLIYYALGLVLCAAGYKLFDVFTPFDLNKEIDDHNVAAGMSVAGIFIAISIVISAAII